MGVERITVNGLRVSYDVAGEGPVLLLIHGWAGSRLHWRDATRYLPNFRVVAPDLFGFGDSEELEVCAAEEDYLQLLRFLLTSLQVEHCVIVGHSMGGQIAARLASELGIRIAGVILVEAPVSNELQDIKCPILLVFGQENEERTAIATAQRKQNSLAKVLFINHASHNVMLDQPSVFYRELRQWLAAHSSPFDDNARH